MPEASRDTSPRTFGNKMITLSFRSALAGWLAAIVSTFIVLGFYVGGYTFDGSAKDIVIGIGMIVLCTALLSGLIILLVWLFLLLPMAFLLTPYSWILRLPQSASVGAAAGTTLYFFFAWVTKSESMPLFLIGTFTGLATILYASLSLRRTK